MLKPLLFTAILAGLAFAQDAKTALANASKAMGADNLNSITYSGSASNVGFGQTPSATAPWTGVTVNNYTRAIDFTRNLSRATGATAPPPPAVAGVYNQNITAANTGWTQQLEIATTPWGFLKNAAANSATAKSQKMNGKAYTVVSYMTTQKAPSGMAYKVNGYINDQNMVERVETWVEHPVLGDMHADNSYSDYKDFGGVKVPGKIVQKRGGDVTFEAAIAAGSANPANIATLVTPPAGGPGGGGGGAAAAPPSVVSEKLADGVYRITGGYVAMAVEFKNYILVLEGGQSEARGLAIIAEAKKLIPNKPIRYVFNTHFHFDHTSGLAPFVAEGATIITHQNNRAYLNRTLSTPRTLVGDTLAKANKKPKFQAVAEKMVLKDSMRTVEFHHITNGHTDGMLIAYLPQEKVLFQGDFTLPAAGQQANPFVMALAENLDKLKLDFDRYIPVHAPNPDVPWRRTDVMKATGRN
jgi:glyoxylase-like metal-dependent hydrolase (beta-lactamase superfamily II)